MRSSTNTPRLPRSSSALRGALLGALFLALPLGTADAQGETGFLRGEGNLDVIVGYTFDTYDEFWVGNDRVSMPGVGRIDREAWVLYTAYGLRDDLDLILSGAYVETQSDGAAGAPDESDFQDLLLAAKWRLLERQWGWGGASLAVLPGVKVPLTNYEDNALTAIGDGQTDWRARIVGQVQTNNGLFAALETGYDRRTGFPKDEVPIHLTLGGTIANRVTISPFLSIVDSLGGTDIGPPGTNNFPTNEEDYTRAGVSLYVRAHDHFGLTASWRTTLDGRNTGDVEGFSVGLVFRP